jgi:hypothetical protein
LKDTIFDLGEGIKEIRGQIQAKRAVIDEREAELRVLIG